MSVNALADLELLVCDHHVVKPYGDPFYVRCSRLLLELHRQTMERVNGTWVFSRQLQKDIMYGYPWDLQHQADWIISNSRFDCEERASSDANGDCKT